MKKRLKKKLQVQEQEVLSAMEIKTDLQVQEAFQQLVEALKRDINWEPHMYCLFIGVSTEEGQMTLHNARRSVEVFAT